MFKSISLAAVAGLAVLIVGVLVFAATRPDTFRVQRSTRIDARPETIFALINDFRRWGAWSPYEKLDPNLKRSYSESSSGEGAVYAWEGNSQAGSGSMTITKSTFPQAVSLSLDMTQPLSCHNVVDFTIEPQGEASQVTWAMQGRNSYLAKLFQTFCDMDRLVGGQFEEGLSNLKTVAEREPLAETAEATASVTHH